MRNTNKAPLLRTEVQWLPQEKALVFELQAELATICMEYFFFTLQRLTDRHTVVTRLKYLALIFIKLIEFVSSRKTTYSICWKL